MKHEIKEETNEDSSKSCLTCDSHGVQGRLKVCCPFCKNPDGLSRIHKVLDGKCQLLAAVLDTVNALVVVLDEDGNIIGFNKSCEKASGYCLQEVKGKNLFDLLLVPEEVDLIKAVFKKIKNGYYPNENENYWLTKQGLKRMILWTNTALANEQGKVQYIIATGKDITEQRTAEEELESAINQYLSAKKILKKSEKLAAIGSMAAGITHEIKNPLTVIQGFAQLIKKNAQGERQLQDYISTILEETSQAIRIINDFLQLARFREPVFIKQSVVRLLEEVRASIEPQALANNIWLEYKVSEILPECMFDKHQLKQVLINLCKNAIEAMVDGGILSLSCGRRYNDIIMEIKDTGQGIPPENIRKLGEPFYTTKEHGTGLGLNICYSIIGAHNARLEVDSKEGLGSSFRVYLPVTD